MVPIRMAATVPLMTLAPNQSAISKSNDSLDRSLVTNAGSQMAFALRYTEAASAVTVHTTESSEQLAPEPVDPKGSLTVRVTYIYYCGIPIVRALVCRFLSSLLDQGTSNRDAILAQRLKNAANTGALQQWVPGSPRYALLTGQATMPNQGANYPVQESDP